MKNIWKKGLVGICIITMASLTGCGMRAPVVPPTGCLFSNYEAPLDVDAENTEFGSKRGEATSTAIFALVATGDASIEAAAKNGGIKKVKHVDYRYENTLGFVYQKYTTIVYGD